MTAYGLALFAHSWVRWLVLATGVALLLVSLDGWRRARAWKRPVERLHVAFVASVDTQFLLGVVLFLFASPLASAFRADLSHTVHDHVLRFFGLEHPVTMLVAVAVVHVGRRRTRSVLSGFERHRSVALWVLASLALFAAGMPWPGLRHGRTLARAFPTEPAARGAASSIRCPPSYSSDCEACHGMRGRGDGVATSALSPKPRDFTDPSWRRARSDEELAAVIRDGGARHGLSPSMPPHLELSTREIEELVRCVRSFGATAPSL